MQVYDFEDFLYSLMTRLRMNFGLRLGEKRTIVPGVNTNMNAVELFDNAAYAEGSEVSQSTVPLLRVSDIERSFLKKNPVWRMYLVRPS